MTNQDIIRMARESGLPETATEGVFLVNTDDLEQERKRLHDLNQGLLRALSWIDQRCPVEFLKQQPHRVHWEAAHDAGACARAAIAKATGEAA